MYFLMVPFNQLGFIAKFMLLYISWAFSDILFLSYEYGNAWQTSLGMKMIKQQSYWGQNLSVTVYREVTVVAISNNFYRPMI